MELRRALGLERVSREESAAFFEIFPDPDWDWTREAFCAAGEKEGAEAGAEAEASPPEAAREPGSLSALRDALLASFAPFLSSWAWNREAFDLWTSDEEASPWSGRRAAAEGREGGRNESFPVPPAGREGGRNESFPVPPAGREGGRKEPPPTPPAGHLSSPPPSSSPLSSRPHLWGVLRFGDDVTDEWRVVWLLLEASRRFPRLSARIWDDDGEFLLVEAADGLPRWLTPARAPDRLWIRGGELRLLDRRAFASADARGGGGGGGGASGNAWGGGAAELAEGRGERAAPLGLLPRRTLRALSLLRSLPRSETLAPASVRAPVVRAAEKARRAPMHRATLLLPPRAWRLLAACPHLAWPAVTAFYYRDPDDVTAARRGKAFWNVADEDAEAKARGEGTSGAGKEERGGASGAEKEERGGASGAEMDKREPAQGGSVPGTRHPLASPLLPLTLTFSRCLFAQLAVQSCAPLRGYPLPAETATDRLAPPPTAPLPAAPPFPVLPPPARRRAAELGMRVVMGLEALAADARRGRVAGGGAGKAAGGRGGVETMDEAFERLRVGRRGRGGRERAAEGARAREMEEEERRGERGGPPPSAPFAAADAAPPSALAPCSSSPSPSSPPLPSSCGSPPAPSSSSSPPPPFVSVFRSIAADLRAPSRAVGRRLRPSPSDGLFPPFSLSSLVSGTRVGDDEAWLREGERELEEALRERGGGGEEKRCGRGEEGAGSGEAEGPAAPEGGRGDGAAGRRSGAVPSRSGDGAGAAGAADRDPDASSPPEYDGTALLRRLERFLGVSEGQESGRERSQDEEGEEESGEETASGPSSTSGGVALPRSPGRRPRASRSDLPFPPPSSAPPRRGPGDLASSPEDDSEWIDPEEFLLDLEAVLDAIGAGEEGEEDERWPRAAAPEPWELAARHGRWPRRQPGGAEGGRAGNDDTDDDTRSSIASPHDDGEEEDESDDDEPSSFYDGSDGEEAEDEEESDGGGTAPGDGSGARETDSGGAAPGDGSGTRETDGGGTAPGDGSGTRETDGGGAAPGDGSGTRETDGGGAAPGDGSGTRETDGWGRPGGDRIASAGARGWSAPVAASLSTRRPGGTGGGPKTEARAAAPSALRPRGARPPPPPSRAPFLLPEVLTETDSDDDLSETGSMTSSRSLRANFLALYDDVLERQLAGTRAAAGGILRRERAEEGGEATQASAPGARPASSRPATGTEPLGSAEPSPAPPLPPGALPLSPDQAVVESLLASYVEQEGRPGPVQNLAGLLGIELPRPPQPKAEDD